MRALLEAAILAGVVVLIETLGYGVESVVLLSAAAALRKLWRARLKAEFFMSLAGISSRFPLWIFVGFPFALAARTLAFAAFLIPIYILFP